MHPTVPRSGLDCDGRTSSTSVSQNSVSPWKTGAGCLSRSVARFAIALPETAHAHAEGERVDQRPDDHVAALLGLRGVDVVDVQRVVVHGEQAEQVVVGLRHRLGRPVLVDRADLELLEIAAVGMGAEASRAACPASTLRSVSVLMPADAASSRSLGRPVGLSHAQPPRLRQAARGRS